jgi:methionine sulfoxide reductase catalytic subunit
MLLRHAPDLSESEITDHGLYLDRRRFLALAAAAAAFPAPARAADDKPTPFEAITTYNNFYEFGTGKEDPAEKAPKLLKTRPWSVAVEGHCARPGVVGFEDLVKPHAVEERIYRLRCVEGWSMVVPWMGVPLAEVIKRFEPTAQAKYVEFATLADPQQMPGVRSPVLDWPYVEGLRLDEAMHPLTLLATGLYGKELLPQNGAPIRLVVPWKYGFKSIKSIVRIRFVDTEPKTAWVRQNAREYGFYSNVNPKVDHPRWSQAKERRIGEFLRRDTLMFNGYADQVAHLYAGMDLAKYF